MIEVQFMPASYRHSCFLASERQKSLPMMETTTLSPMRSEFGQRLFDARKHAKLTQAVLASAVGTSQANLGELEKKGLSSGLTPAIAARCGVAIEWLAYGKGEMLAREPAQGQRQNSPEAQQIADLFDLIPVRDKIRRAQAMAAAINSILAVLPPQRATAPAAADNPPPEH